MKILLNDESPILSRPRRFAFAETNVIDEQIEQWLDKGIIEDSDSEFTSPVVLAKENDGSQRLCVDFRRINKVIVKDHFPLPLIDDQRERLKKRWYSAQSICGMAFSMCQSPNLAGSTPHS